MKNLIIILIAVISFCASGCLKEKDKPQGLRFDLEGLSQAEVKKLLLGDSVPKVIPDQNNGKSILSWLPIIKAEIFYYKADLIIQNNELIIGKPRRESVVKDLTELSCVMYIFMVMIFCINLIQKDRGFGIFLSSIFIFFIMSFLISTLNTLYWQPAVILIGAMTLGLLVRTIIKTEGR